jgi:hypothetical protein
MHITWIISGSLTEQEGRLTSTMASIRYRILYVAEHLAAQGHQIDILQAGVAADEPRLSAPLSADVVVMSKGLFDGSVPLARRAKSLGAQLVLDLCDDHFSTSFRETYLALATLADGITVSTPEMASVVAAHTSRTSEVLEDPFEAPHGIPTFAPNTDRVRLLWFGHPTNFDTLSAMLPEVLRFSAEHPTHLHVVSQDQGNVAAALGQWTREYRPRLTTQFSTWSAASTWQAMDDCDVVVIPSLPAETKLVKSPNRMVESIRRGKFVSAFPLPSYRPFAEFAWLGEHVVGGVRWALRNAEATLQRIERGQSYVEQHHSPALLAERWQSVLTRYAASRAVKCFKPASAMVLPGSIDKARA